jgi:hypothetical protein
MRIHNFKKRLKSLKQYYSDPNRCKKCDSIIEVLPHQKSSSVQKLSQCRFCSNYRNGSYFSFSDKIKEKARELRREGFGYITISNKLLQYTDKHDEIPHSTIRNWVDDIKVNSEKAFKKSIDERQINKDRKSINEAKSKSTIRHKLLNKRGKKCQSCGKEEWKNKPIPLEIHRIDDTKSYAKCTEEDLKILCPNCHFFTDNWGNRTSEFNIRLDKCANKDCNNFTTHNPTSRCCECVDNAVWDFKKEVKEYKQNQKIEKPNKPNKCADCGKSISRQAERCKSCAQKNIDSEKIDWPNKDDLIKLVKNKNFLQAGRELDVSDNAIRKRLKSKYNIDPKTLT